MVIEYLIGDKRYLLTPTVFFAAGALYSLISTVFAIILFPSSASTSHVLLATVAVAPLIFKAIVVGAHILDREPHRVLAVQSWLLSIYLAYMLGAVIGFQVAYIATPQQLRYTLLQEQINELEIIEGVRIKLTGMAVKDAMFWIILTNNLRVYLLSILLSFIYGTGGMLLLNWNASILATLFLQKLHSNPLAYILRIFPHTLFEFLGYFTGGITGVLIGVALIQEGWNRRLLKDVTLLFLLGIGFILLGALIESGFI